MSKEIINIEFKIIDKFRGGVENLCDVCEITGRITLSSLTFGSLHKDAFATTIYSQCLKKLKDLNLATTSGR
mgnify:CR=1 FL=1